MDCSSGLNEPGGACLRGSLLWGVIAALLRLLHGQAHAQATKDQQRCIRTLNLDFQKVAAKQGKEICQCIKAAAKGNLAGSVEACLTSDPKGQVRAAMARADANFDQKCMGSDKQGVLRLPYFGPTEPRVLKAVAQDKEIALVHDVFGLDLDLAIRPQDGGTKEVSRCQLAVVKAVKKCQDEKLKAFNRCKAMALKGRDLRQAVSGPDLAGTCLVDPNGAGIPDPQGKIAKACVTKLGDAINKQCAGVDQAVAFPGECAQASDLRACLAEITCGHVCRALSEVDNLDVDACDVFDPDPSVEEIVAELSATGGGTPPSPPPPDFPDPNGIDPSPPGDFFEHDLQAWPKPLDLSWVELTGPNDIVTLPTANVTLIATNLADEAVVVDITIYVDAGGPDQTTTTASLSLGVREDPFRLTVPLDALGFDLDNMRYSGLMGAVAQVRSSAGELLAVEVSPELYYHRATGQTLGITAYGTSALAESFRSGDFNGLADVADLEGVVRISDGGEGNRSPGPVPHPNDDRGYLPGLTDDPPTGEPTLGIGAP
jgi:hypothetical protein